MSRRLGLIALVLLLGGCPGQSASVVPAPAPPPEPQPEPLHADALYADVQRLCAPELAGRGSYQKGIALASQFIHDELSRLGFEVQRQPLRGRHAENIIAIKKGDEQAVMVSAHHDHLGRRNGKVYLGADDNASGVAVLLGIARSRAMQHYKHTVLFVSFGAEEDGLVGSGLYIRQPAWPLGKTRAVINFDMVGRNFFEAGANQASAVAIVGLEGVEPARAVARRAAASVGLRVIDVPARLLELFALDDRTDEWWFRRQDIPSIHFSTGLHEDYHEVTDTVDKIVPEQLARIAHTAGALLDALAIVEDDRS